MAPDPTSDDAAAIVDAVAKPPEGVVLPPKDIRTIIEKTAGYVARSGGVFEQRIRDKEASNPKFSFLTPDDAYNPFYLWRLSEIREGRGTAVSAGRVGEQPVDKEPEKPKGPPAPPDFRFSARMPNISAQDLDVVRLTALFVAKNGRSFLTTLSQRETRNFQFDFLRPQHSLHQFFSRLVDQYTDLLQAPTVESGKAQTARLAELQANVSNRFHVLERAQQRAEYVKWQQQQKQMKEEEEEKERVEYAQIDWHDFVVVQTVLFDDSDEQAALPPPTSLNDLQTASLEQKAAMSLQPASMRIEEAMPTGDDLSYTQYQQQQEQPPAMASANLPAPPNTSVNGHGAYAMPPPAVGSSAGYPPAAPPGAGFNEDEARAIAERTTAREQAQAAQAAARATAAGPGAMRIRSDYVPRAQARRQNASMGVCPNCHQQIPMDEMSEHMRIELLDPRWKEQRQKAEAHSFNAGRVDVAANLKRLASQQMQESQPGGGAGNDMSSTSTTNTVAGGTMYGVPAGAGPYGGAGAGAGAGAQGAMLTPDEEARRKRVALSGEGLDVQEQIRKLHERYKT